MKMGMNLDPINELLQAPPFAPVPQMPAFLEAFEACLAVLRARFPRYAAFLDEPSPAAGNGSGTFWDEVKNLHPLFLPVLKSYRFPLPPGLAIAKRLTSSGTTGQPSEMPLDEPSWRWRIQAMRASYLSLELFAERVEVLAFLMDPGTTHMAGSLVIDAVLREIPQVCAITYLARMGEGGPEFQPTDAARALLLARERGPVLLVGYPALIAASMKALLQTGRRCLPLAAGSGICTGGGWKSFLPGVVLDQRDFRTQAAAFFGLAPGSIRDMFGLSECPAVFVQCEQEHYHVPVWAWARAIDPETFQEVVPGEMGLLELTVPLTTSYPLLKVLTTDKVTMNQGCRCGRPAPFLTPQGRVTAARYETCAMKIGRAVAGGRTDR
jgi:phenylacetate-coenzyme A ligase PaaK-like adenylate-forming protein